MRPWTRRSFLGAAAAICIGCSDESGAVRSGPTSTVPPPDTTPPAPTAPPGTVPRGAIRVDTLAVVEEQLASEGAVYVQAARAFLAPVPSDAIEPAVAAYDEELHEGFRAGLVALYEKCPHLGCRVPFCETSGWFECACHGALFNSIGEHELGPSDRGLDLLEVHIVDDVVHVLPRIHRGLPTGEGVAVDVARGPHCVESLSVDH